MYYFAYGSNMSLQRLRQRLANIDSLGYASAPGYRVVFHKRGSHDGSGKCGLVSGQATDLAHGVLYRIDDADKPLLDQIEGVGQGYRCVQLSIDHSQLGSVRCETYIATILEPGLQLFDWYLQHVLTGAREHDLPDDYITSLEALPVIRDSDPGRSARELAIYSPSPDRN